MLCPNHKIPLEARRTRYGVRRQCQEPGCTVVCWDGSTSTPADFETRQLRHACHEVFDPIWRSGRIKRGRAYRILAKAMSLSIEQMHFGMLDIDQCRRVLELVEQGLFDGRINPEKENQ